MFWDMHDRLSLPLLFALAKALGLSERELRDALVNEKYAPRVKSDFIGGVRSGVNGTPCIFINNVRYNGERDARTLIDLLNEIR